MLFSTTSAISSFVSLLPKESQKFITTTNLDWLPNDHLEAYKKYIIDGGKIN